MNAAGRKWLQSRTDCNLSLSTDFQVRKPSPPPSHTPHPRESELVKCVKWAFALNKGISLRFSDYKMLLSFVFVIVSHKFAH